MKIALVSLNKDSAKLFPVGILCIASYIKHHAPTHQIKIIDAAFEKDVWGSLVKEKFDLIGISAMTPEYEEACRLAFNLLILKIPLIIGGCHISKLPSSLRSVWTCGVIGEGEETFLDLIRHFSGELKGSLEDIPGLVIRENKSIIITQPRSLINLQNFPPLDYSLLHPSYFIRRELPSFSAFGIRANMMTSRGCPYKCYFCAGSHMWDKLRYFPTSWVLNEVKALYEKGVTHVEIFDDVFAMKKSRLNEISQLIREGNYHKSMEFYGNAKADVIDDEICQIVKSMNMNTLFFGFESGNPRVLKLLKCDKVTIEDNKRAVLLCNKHNIRVMGNVILGSPTETKEEMEDTIAFIDWCKRNKVYRLLMSVMTPYPGTPLWEDSLRRGKVSNDMNFELLTVNAQNMGLKGYVLDDSVSSVEFEKICKRALSHLHSYKWHKAIQFLFHNPIDTIRFILKSPWPLIKRMFVRYST